MVFLEERTIINDRELENREKIQSQEILIQNLREQIDNLKSSCFDP